jgi:hypothetical protein
MSDMNPATDATKNELENAISWYLNDKLASSGTTIATQKYLTTDNRLIYLTRCTVASSAIPTVKVQIFERVEGGVHETGYQLYSDRRLESYKNAMIFGTTPSGPDITGQPVDEPSAQARVALISALQSNARAII